jgi:tetratricopeptide (TPR) repeat protein
MELLPPIGLKSRLVGDHPDDQSLDRAFQQFSVLCNWMMVLGTIRLACVLADYGSAIAEAIRLEPISMRMMSRLSAEFHPIVVVSAAWPLILAIALRRTRWRQLLPATAATFLILSIGGIIELSVQWSQARGYGGMVGSFHLNRRAFITPTMSDLALGTLGATQLLAELAIAIRAILLVPAIGSTPATNSTRQERARRARQGRISFYISLGYLFVVIRLPVWSTYLELLNNSPLVRNFVLENDQRSNWRRASALRIPQLTAIEKRFNELGYLVTAAYKDAQNGLHTQARDRYQEIVAAIDSITDEPLPRGGKSLHARALNNLAWLQATCPQIDLRSPSEAVRNARRATVIEPHNGDYWNTLGAAHYRAGDWDDARDALGRSMKLRNDGDCADWFFLALVELKLGRLTDARRWYEKAAAQLQQSALQDEELYRFQVEAATELGLAVPEPHEIASKNASAMPSRLITPGSIKRLVRRRSAEDGGR